MPVRMRRFQTVVVVVAIILMALVVRPVALPLFFAAILAGLLHPLYFRLTRRFRGRRGVVATALTMSVFLAVVGPIMGLVAAAGAQAKILTHEGQLALKDGRVDTAIGRLPVLLQGSVKSLISSVPSAAEVVGADGFSTTLTSVVSVAGEVMLTFALIFVALFFFLREGRALVVWLEGVLPMPPGQFVSILGEFRKVSRSVLMSVGLTAGVQAVSGLIGLLLARVPNAFFFAFLSFVMALIPMVGAASCYVLIGAVLLLNGSTGAGAFLILWGIVVVGLVDNMLRPLFIGDGAAMHSGVVFFSLIGGLAAFGVAGLLLGPLVVAFFLAVIRVHNRVQTAAAAGAQPRSGLALWPNADLPAP